jgi:hypothetical protein
MLVHRHPHSERGLDPHQTALPAIEALLRVEPIPHRVWEPAGRGVIVGVLRDHGHAVIASDICDYGFPLHFIADFLTQTQMPTGCEAIVSNPAYQIAAKFIAHALKLSPLVIMLLHLAFYEAGELGNKRLDRHLRSLVLDSGSLARIHVFRKRLPMMHRDEWAGRKANSGMAFAWYVWERSHVGPPTIGRISWEPGKRRAGTHRLAREE